MKRNIWWLAAVITWLLTATVNGEGVRIHYPCYGVNIAERMRLDGAKETMEGIHRVMPLVMDKVDLVIEGRFRNFGQYKDRQLPYHVFGRDYPVVYKPGAVYVAYILAPYVVSDYDPYWSKLDALEAYFLHDVKGRRVMADRARNYYMIWPGPIWREHLGQVLADKFRGKPRLNGVFLDVCWHHINYRNRFWVQEGEERQPAVLTEWARAHWQSEMAATLKYISGKFPDKKILFNGFDGTEGARRYLAATAGGMCEGFVHAHWNDRPAETSLWLRQVKDLATVSRYRCYLAASGIDRRRVGPTDEARVAMWAFCSYLLGNAGHGYYCFTPGPGPYRRFVYYDYWDLDIGRPEEDFHSDDGKVYQRKYEKALVLASPRAEKVTYKVTGEYSGYLDGRGVYHKGSPPAVMEMEAGSGRILMRP